MSVMVLGRKSNTEQAMVNGDPVNYIGTLLQLTVGQQLPLQP